MKTLRFQNYSPFYFKCGGICVYDFKTVMYLIVYLSEPQRQTVIKCFKRC